MRSKADQPPLPKVLKPLILKQTLLITADMAGAHNEFIEFTDFCTDEAGNIFLSDSRNVKIYKFDTQGKWQKTLLNKGEGPGEFSSSFSMQINDGNLYVNDSIAKKIAVFNADGVLLKEIRQTNFVRDLVVIKKDQYAAFSTSYDLNNRNLVSKSLSIYNLLNDTLENKIYKSPKNGSFAIEINQRSIPVYPPPGVIPDLQFAMDSNESLIYLVETDHYKIHVFNNSGDKLKTLELQAVNAAELADDEKNTIVNEFGNIADYQRKQIFEKLPKKLCLIKKIDILDSRWILLQRMIGLNEIQLDVFSKEGDFIHAIEFPNKKAITRFRVSPGKLICLEQRNEDIVYAEYEIENFDDLFPR